MRAGINALTATFVVGVLAGLLATADGRQWLRHPTLMLGGSANASAPPAVPVSTPILAAAPAVPIVRITPLTERVASGALRVGVFGDSMADGLWTGLYRDLRDTPGVTVTKFSEVSTGLSRYDYVDIQAKTTRQLAEQPIDVAVILFGTNDAQGIDIAGTVHPFGSDGWEAAYARRVDDLVALLRGRDIAVYWVGLPRMKRPGFDDRMTIINSVVEARMKALGVPYLSTLALTSDADGDYDAYLGNASGRRQLMRAGDGIHMSMAGYLRLSDMVADRLKQDAGLASAPAITTITPAPTAG